jgi:tetratricopeptide (TPR) repeat protein
VKKWIITILAAAAALALALTERTWAQWIVSFAHGNHERIDELNTFAELISKFVMWPAAAVLFIIGLWLKKKDADVGHAQTVSVQNSQAARDINTAAHDVQTGGAHAERDLKVDGNVINRQTNIYQAAAPALTTTPSPLHQLPPAPADFTGRTTELRELRAAIEKGGIHISGLQGQGGVGKTALALKLAEELSPNYPDAQIYLDLKGVSENPLTAAEAISHVLRTFHPEARLPEKEEDLRAQYLSVLHNKRVLLLMDNARDAAQVRLLIPPSGSTLLVTSRQHFTLPGLHPKNLNTLPPADAKALLLQIESRIGGEAEAIAELCGYLPLALRLAATALAEREDIPPADYKKRLADEKLKLLAGSDESVEASITLSYNLLDAETQKRWRMLAVFPDTFDAPAAAAVWEIEADSARDTLSRLLQFSMLEWNESTRRYRLHDLMRDFAHQRLTPAESDDASRRHASHYGDLLAAADDLYLKGSESILRGLALFDLEWGNVQAGQAWVAAHATKDAETAELCSRYPDYGAYTLSLRQHPRERIRWLEPAVTAARRLKDRKAECHHLASLGGAHYSMGNHRRGIEYYEKTLAIAQETGDRKDEASALGNMGVAYYFFGDYHRSIALEERSLSIKREIRDRRGEGNALGNLGNAYDGLGEYQRAIEYHDKHLAITREIGDRRGEGTALGNLGIAYMNQGNYRRAIEYYEKQLAISREIVDRQGEGNTFGNLGNAHADLGDHHRALEYYQQQVRIAREIGDRHGEGTALFNKSLALDKLGERKKAIEDADAALKIYEQIEHPSAPKVRICLDMWRNG